MQFISITSEALQATVRRLLPSQQGFGEDLQASNVITPIIDLTPTAEGSALPSDLAQAASFDSSTAFEITNTTTALANSPGFWRFFGAAYCVRQATANHRAHFTVSNGLSSKIVWGLTVDGVTNENNGAAPFDFVVFLQTGDSVSGLCDLNDTLVGSYRQIATVTGEIVNPTGFVSQ